MLETFTFPDIETIKAVLIGIAVIVYIVVSFLFRNVSILEVLDFREIGVFNTREIATVIWIIIGFYAILARKRGLQISIKGLLITFFVKEIVIACLLALLYLFVTILFLNSLNVWRLPLLKDAIIWLIFSASLTMFGIHKAKNNYFKNIILDNFKFSIIIEFIIGQHTFNLLIEIFIVGFSILIGLLLVFMKGDKYENTRKMLNVIIISTGGVMLYFSSYHVIQNIDNFNVLEKISEFSLPIFLTVWFTPFFFLLFLYMNYESRFTAMKFSIKDNNVLLYAKRKSIITFRTDIESLNRWVYTIVLDEPKTKDDIQKSILKFKAVKSIEKNPPNVNSDEGWSPYEAKDFLKNDGIETNFYKKCFDNEWQAISSYKELNTDLISEDGNYYIANNVAYYVSGDNRAVKKLKLVLNVNSKYEEELSLIKFNEYVKSLYKAALGKTLPAAITKSIINRKNKNVKLLKNKVSILKQDFLNKNRGYSLVFVIAHEQSADHTPTTQDMV